LKAGSFERSPFPLAVFGFSIISDVIRLLLQDERQNAMIPVKRMITAVKCLFIGQFAIVRVQK
jgi:hypothetical protein